MSSHLALLLLAAVSTTTVAQEIPFDVHVHYTPNELYQGIDISNGADDFLKQKIAKKSFLISPSYHVMKVENRYTSGSQTWRRNLKFRVQLDQATSKLVGQNPDRFHGLCGYNPTWRDGIKIVKRCLDYKGMVGIKIHTGYTGTGSEDRRYKRILNMLTAVEDKKPFVLWHIHHTTPIFSGNIYWDEYTKSEVKKLFEVINTHPQITFIMAHSLFNPGMVSYLVELEKMSQKANNLFIEISANWDRYGSSNSLYENYVKSWREFGFERVFYGSDLGFENFKIEKHVQAIILSDMLTQQEKEILLIENGRKLERMIQEQTDY